MFSHAVITSIDIYKSEKYIVTIIEKKYGEIERVIYYFLVGREKRTNGRTQPKQKKKRKLINTLPPLDIHPAHLNIEVKRGAQKKSDRIYKLNISGPTNESENHLFT